LVNPTSGEVLGGARQRRRPDRLRQRSLRRNVVRPVGMTTLGSRRPVVENRYEIGVAFHWPGAREAAQRGHKPRLQGLAPLGQVFCGARGYQGI